MTDGSGVDDNLPDAARRHILQSLHLLMSGLTPGCIGESASAAVLS